MIGRQEPNLLTAYLNEQLTGLDLHEVRRRLLYEMEEEKNRYDRMIRKVLELGRRFIGSEPECELYLEGTANILNLPEFADLDKMKALLLAFEEKAVIVKLLNQCMTSDGVNVFIGSENENLVMGDVSLVVANYKRGDRTLGSLGVLGPTRMEYERVIPIVDQTARALTRVLSED